MAPTPTGGTENTGNLSRVISTILRHDAKNTSYKIALVRAINDVALAFPDLPTGTRDVAIPLRFLAEFWVAYYWPFVEEVCPIRQGMRRQTANGLSSDMEFRSALTELRSVWEQSTGVRSTPAEGFTVSNDLRLIRKRDLLSPVVVAAYLKTVRAITKAIQMPIRYAGPKGEEWTVFAPPAFLKNVETPVVPVPGTLAEDLCLILSADLWREFRSLSLWVEALCLHEWCLFTATVRQDDGTYRDRGDIYRLLTERTGRRQALTWERNHINILLMEEHTFTCPWTEKRITRPGDYDLDHLVPVSVYPLNELWNLVPSDPAFNQHRKRDRLPAEAVLLRAEPHLERAYGNYGLHQPLAVALRQDVGARFSLPAGKVSVSPADLSHLVHSFITRIAEARNVARF